MKYILAASLTLVTGCAQMNAEIASGQARTIATVKMANDNMVEAVKAATCAIPVGAVFRHPDIIPNVMNTCSQPSDGGVKLF